MTSARQREILEILVYLGGETDGWSEVWTHYNGSTALDFRNFDRVADALVRRGWVNKGDDIVAITEAGRRQLLTGERCGHCDEPSTRPINAPCPFNHPDCWICWDCYERLTADVPAEKGTVP